MISRLLSIIPLGLFVALVVFVGYAFVQSLAPASIALTPADNPTSTQTVSLPAATDTATPTPRPTLAAATQTPTPTTTPTEVSVVLTPTDTPMPPTPTQQPVILVWVQAGVESGEPPHTLGLLYPGGENPILQPYAAAPSLSPDGTRLAFFSESSLSGLNTGIWIADIVDGVAVNHRQVVDITNVQNVAWSPDGLNLAFEIILNPDEPRDAWQSQIRIVRADPDSADELARFDGRQPAWSPDGQELTLYTCRGSECGLFVLNCAGGGVCDEASSEQITFDSTDSFPAWSPDGRLAFASKRSGDHEIYLRLADGNLVDLTNRASADTTPVFSPDGRKIFIRTDAPEGITWNLQVITLNEERNAVQDITTLLEDVGGDDNWGLAKPAVR